MAYLVLVRHGKTEWNEDHRFTGWTDIPLSEEGKTEMENVGHKLMQFKFDLCFCSALKRTRESLDIILTITGNQNLPIISDHALNERDYGDLTGQLHQEVIDEFGIGQFDQWHRSWNSAPPHGESLKDTHDRVVPYFNNQIMPELKKGRDVLIVSSGNSLRALVKEIEHLTPIQITELEIPTGEVLLFECNEKGKLYPVK